MKHIKSFIVTILALLLLFVGCANFPTSYNRIDADRVRVIDFIYEPAEAAPGDSVTLIAIFAGKEADSIDWRVSFDILTDVYGTNTTLNIQPLEYREIENSDFSSNTKTVKLKFKIPDSLMYTSRYLQDAIIDSVVQMVAKEANISGLTITKEMLITMVEYYCDNAPIWDSLMNFERLLKEGNDSAEALSIVNEIDSTLSATDPLYQLYAGGVKEYLPALLQLLSTKIRLFAKPNNGFENRSSYIVRYNSKLSGISGLPIYENTNPQVAYVGIYKVKGANLASFDTAIHKQEYELIPLFGESDSLKDSISTIKIEKGYTYFFTATSNAPDSVLSLDKAFQDNPTATEETHFFQWYFQHDENEIDGVDAFDFLSIPNSATNTILISPPDDKRVQSFVLWVEVWDYFLNEMTRPMASSVKEVRGKFVY